MGGPPPAAIRAAAAVICDWLCGTDPATCRQMPGHQQLAEGVILAAEKAWPHEPPKRDPASTTTMTTDRAWTGARRAPASAFGFGFGFGKDVTG